MAKANFPTNQHLENLPNAWPEFQTWIESDHANIRVLQKLLEGSEVQTFQSQKDRALFSRMVLMGCYLITESLCEAKFLYSRVASRPEMRKKNLWGEFAQLWKIGQCLYKEKYVPVDVEDGETAFSYMESFEWGMSSQCLLKILAQTLREKKRDEIAMAYSSISVSELCALLNYNEKEVDGIVSGWGWQNDAGVVIPTKIEAMSSLNPYAEIETLRRYLQSCESKTLVTHAQDAMA